MDHLPGMDAAHLMHTIRVVRHRRPLTETCSRRCVLSWRSVGRSSVTPSTQTTPPQATLLPMTSHEGRSHNTYVVTLLWKLSFHSSRSICYSNLRTYNCITFVCILDQYDLLREVYLDYLMGLQEVDEICV